MKGADALLKKNKRDGIRGKSSLRVAADRFRRNKLAVAGSFLFVFIALCAVFAPLVAPYPPDKIVGKFSGGPSAQFLLGTDQIGRDMLSRLLYATRVSLLVGLASAGIAVAVGVVLGLLSGYFGGWVDMVIMRFTDMIMSFPSIMLVLVAAAIVGPGLRNIILILGFVNWPEVARLVRGNVLSLRESNFVKNSLIQGMPTRFLLFSEILPNTVAPVLVYAASVIVASMLDEAALSFLGLGVQPPTASLGNMLNGAQSLTILTSKPWLWVPPGVLIVLLVLITSFIGDALRDASDPRNAR